MKKVLIIEKKTKRVVATVPIQLGGANYTPTEQEYFAEAWRCAISDKTVDANHKDDYSFTIVDAPLRM